MREQNLVPFSVATQLLTKIRPFQEFLLSWMRYFSEIFWRHSLDVFAPFPNNYNLFVCLPVCLLAYLQTEIRQMQRCLLFWMRYIPEIFLRPSWDVCTLIPNNKKIIACLSVIQFAYFHTEIIPIQGYLLFWMRQRLR